MNAREEVLWRTRAALPGCPPRAPVPRGYRTAGTAVADLARFADRVSDYRARVLHAGPRDVAGRISAALADGGITRVVVPAGFPGEWLDRVTADLVSDDPALTAAQLDAVPGVITTCAAAVAETGSIILDAGPGQGRRALSLVPDYHLVVVRGDQVLALVPDAVAAVDPHRPQTWISGPSATSDIELSRVEGVHGPRTLVVVLVP